MFHRRPSRGVENQKSLVLGRVTEPGGGVLSLWKTRPGVAEEEELIVPVRMALPGWAPLRSTHVYHPTT